MKYKLGKKPARLGAVSFAMGQFFDRSALPTPPLRIGHEKIGIPWQLFQNDVYSDCVWAGAAHEHMIWTHEGGTTAHFTDANVLADYSTVTGFNPSKPDSDQGTDMQMAASYRRNIGVIDAAGIRHKIDAYVAPRIGNVDDLALLAYLTGAVGVGLMLPDSAMDQFDAGKPWVPVANSGTAGGHYVSCLGRNSNGDFLIITWGKIQAMSAAFYSRFSDETIGYLSLEVLKNKLSPEGFDEVTLRAQIAKLSTPKEST